MVLFYVEPKKYMFKYLKGNYESQEQLKKAYKVWAFKLHPDCQNGSVEEFQTLQQEYETLFQQVKNKQVNYNGNVYEKETQEKASDFINIINEIIKMGLQVELIGTWLWITGNTKEHKEELKALGCKWAPKKGCWSWHFEEGRKRYYKGEKSLDELRGKYGSQTFTSATSQKMVVVA